MIETIFTSLGLFLLLLVLIALTRILLGPTLADRVVGMDTANTLMVSAFLVLAAGFREIVFVEVAIVYAMFSFVATMFFAKYLEGAEWSGN